MTKITNGDLTTGHHHLFWSDPDDDYWLQSHLALMEKDGFRVVAATSDTDRGGILFVMVKTELAA
jgi:hypothetical protein